MSNLRFFLAAFLLLVAGVVPCAAAEHGDPTTYGALRERYLKLRNTDIRVTKADEWRDVAEQLTKYADSNRGDATAGSALFNASVLYEKLYRKFQDSLDIETASGLLQRFLMEYPKAPLAEQALMKLGDMMVNDFGKKNAGRVAYEELIERFPKSTLVVSARMRKGPIDAEAEGAVQDPLRAEDFSEALGLDDAGSNSIKKRTGKIQTPGPVIVLDPGHGGEDFGASGIGGVLEKDVVFEVAQRLRSLLEAKLNAQVFLTRESDDFVPLQERTEFANEKGADVFISLHTNASPQHAQSGFETYFLDNTDDAGSLKLAERENGAFQAGTESGDLAFMLSDLIQSGKLEASQRLASAIQASLSQVLKKRAKSRGVRKAPFYVLVGAHMPCVLVELLFIDHHDDGKRLGDGAVRRELADGVYQGVKQFVGKSSGK